MSIHFYTNMIWGLEMDLMLSEDLLYHCMQLLLYFTS